MRDKLKKIGSDDRHKFYGTFDRFGIKNGYCGIEKTVLLRDIKDENGTVITDHLWFNFTKGFSRVDLKEGCTVEFYARVAPYWKGYFGYRDDVYNPPRKDYKLSYPTKIKLVA